MKYPLSEDRSPGWAHRIVRTDSASTGRKLINRLARVRVLGAELISAAEWGAEALERKARGDIAGHLEALEIASLSISRVADLLPECSSSVLAARRRSEDAADISRKPSNLWYAEIGRRTRAARKAR